MASLAGLAGAAMRGLDRHDLADARGRSRRLRHLVPHFRQLTERAGAEHREQDKLRQRAAGHPSRDHVLRAEPKHDDDAREGEEDRRGGDESARLTHRPRGLIGAVCGVAIAAGGEQFGDERLHDAHRRQAFGGESGGLGKPVLGASGTLPDRASGRIEGQHDQGNRRQHEGRQFGAGDHHHRDRADEQEQIAQRERRRGAECRLELGRVGGETRGDVAGLLGVEKARIEPGQVGEEIGAKVGDHPFAQRHHEVVSGAGGQREHRDDTDHGQEIGADEAGVGVGKPVVDHPPDRDRHDQRRAGSDDHRDERQSDSGAMGERVRRERPQRGERRAGRPRSGVGGG